MDRLKAFAVIVFLSLTIAHVLVQRELMSCQLRDAAMANMVDQLAPDDDGCSDCLTDGVADCLCD